MKQSIRKPMRRALIVPITSMKACICILSIVLLSCNGQKKPAMGNEVAKSQTQTMVNDPLTFILQDSYAGTDTEETLVIRNEKSLRSFFSKINSTRKPGIPVPMVDFSKELIVVYCSGSQQGEGMPRLEMVEETDTEMTLQMSLETTQKLKNSTATISPFSVYKMPLTSKSVVFKAMK